MSVEVGGAAGAQAMACCSADATPGRGPWRAWGLPTLAGLVGAAGLVGLYLGIVTLAQGWEHAARLLLGDWYLVALIVAGFGVQVGLFTYVRTGMHARHVDRSAKVLAGAGTGTSTVSMLACCAHHVTDVLPLVGLSGAAVFLNTYRTPLMLLGVATNVVGILVMLRLIRRLKHRTV